MIRAGISTATLYPEYTENALKELAVRGVKISEIFFNTASEIEKSFINKLKIIINEYKMVIPSIHPYTCCAEPFMFFTQYERRFLDILDYYKQYFEAMNILGAKYFVFHGNNVNNPFDENMYIDRYNTLVQKGKEFGIQVVHENVARCTGGDLEFCKKLINQLGNDAKFVLDTKQAVRRGFSPYQFLNEIGNNIVHIHISDAGEKGDCLLIGEGKLDFCKFINELTKYSFDGSIILELYTNCYENYDQLIQNLDYMNNIIKSCI